MRDTPTKGTQFASAVRQDLSYNGYQPGDGGDAIDPDSDIGKVRGAHRPGPCPKRVGLPAARMEVAQGT